MPRLVLTSSTGTAVEIQRNRLLKAGSDGAPAGYLAAYPGGWVVYPLPGRHPVRVNRTPLAAPRRLRIGDVLDLGGRGYDITACVAAGPVTARLVGPTCGVSAVAGDDRKQTPKAGSPFLIGSAAECDLRLQADGVAPFHVLLAYADAVWHVHDLTGRGVARLTGNPEPTTVVASGEMLWVGPVELTLSCSPFERLGADTPLDGTADYNPPPRQAHRTTPVAAVETDEDPGFTPLIPPAAQLCKWVQVEMPKLREAAGPAAPPAGGDWFPPADPLAAFDYYKAQLARHPADARLLFALADRFADLGFLKFERLLLREALKYHASNFDLLSRLGACLFKAGVDPKNPPGERVKDLERADRYAGQALTLRPDSPHLRELRTKVAAERARLRLPAPAAETGA